MSPKIGFFCVRFRRRRTTSPNAMLSRQRENLPASTPFIEKIPFVESTSSSPAEEPPPCQSASAIVLTNPAPTTQEKISATLNRPSVPSKPARKGRAAATKGADIVSQDGFKAKYRRKCTVCGQKDQVVQTIIIANRTTNSGYYFPKCKKRGDATIQRTL
jgi:hypothetical protein